MILSNLIAWSAQVAVIVALGTALYYLLRIDVPRLRHAYWQGLLALCLCLPLLQAWTPPVPVAPEPALAQAAPEAMTLSGSMQTGRATSNEPIDWPRIAAQVLAAGAVLRLAWTAIGLWRLRGLRRAGRPADDSEHAELKAIIGTVAELRYVSHIEQPVTFGLRRPVVILPEALRTYPDEVQRAVVCHELCHVRRRDWAWLLAEEVVRAALWFHPAVWWVISRIQLTREEAVDAAVIGTTGQRRVYAEALMVFADAAPLTPAAAFSRRRHLVTRILLISKEAVMSSKRIVASCTVMAVSIAAGSWYVVQAFPLQGAAVATAPTPGQRVGGPRPVVQGGQAVVGPLERQAKPTTPENPIPRRTSSVPVELPPGASPDFNALVELKATIDQQGRIAELRATRAVGMPPDLVPSAQAAAIDAVKQWQYDPPAEAPISFGVTVLFNGTGNPIARQSQDGGQPGDLTAERLQIGPGGVTAGAPVAVRPVPPGAVRVGGAVRQPTKTRHVNPVYPPIAQSARVQGVVIIEAVIGTDGNVEDARILRSIPLLDEAALDAVRQWAFTPTLLNGQPTPLVMTVTVQFSLPEEAVQPQALLRQGLVSAPWRLHRVLNLLFPVASTAVDGERQ